MASFFEKLKKGMGVEDGTVEELFEEEGSVEEKLKKKKVNSSRKPRVKKPPVEEPPVEESPVEESPVEEIQKLEIKTASVESKKEEEPKNKEEEKEEWFEPEGQLAIDVYQTENELIIQSAIAGVKSENLDVSLEKDIIAIKGCREKPFEKEGDYFTQECYWGSFSREIIMPVEVDPSRALAELKEGILTIRIPKIVREKKKKITVKIV